MLTAGKMHRIFPLRTFVYPDFRQILHRPLARFLLAQAQHLNRRFHDVFQHRHMAPEIEVLEYHRQACAQ
ncbi:Uncharacterised protein [Shigella sonnei]|nr:Uncharacterised protein [Shigella sonnei]